MQPGVSAAVVYGSKKYVKKTTCMIKETKKSSQITVFHFISFI